MLVAQYSDSIKNYETAEITFRLWFLVHIVIGELEVKVTCVLCTPPLIFTLNQFIGCHRMQLTTRVVADI